jgi:tetratricopeptide (TPR) repeat protein
MTPEGFDLPKLRELPLAVSFLSQTPHRDGGRATIQGRRSAPSVRCGQLGGRLCRAFVGTAVLLVVSVFSLATARSQSSASRASQVQLHFERAQAALKVNDPATAAKEFLKVLALEPRNAEAYADLGVVSYLQRNYQQASKYLGSALAIDPSLVKAQALLGICEMELGDHSAQILLQKSFSELQDRGLRTQVGMALARLYYQQGALGQAASVARILVDLNPDNLNVLFMAERIYDDLAYETMNKLAVLASGSAQMQAVIAERLVNAGDLRDAIKHYRKALAIDPSLSGVHFELGEAILRSAPSNAQNQAAAKQEFETAERTEGDSAAIECQLGEIAFRQFSLTDAYAHYRRAFTLDPGDAEADLGLGKVLMTSGKLQQAIAYLRMAIGSDPLNADAHYRLAVAYDRLKLTDESKKEFHLFQDIKQTKERVKLVYSEMDPRTRAQWMPGVAEAKAK